MIERKRVVSIIGASICTQEEADLAEQVGYKLAIQGIVIVTGGRGGVMEAASRGARNAGGLTIGLLPGSDHGGGNEYVQIEIPTGLGDSRNAIVAQAGEAVIAIGGGYGTLSEIGFALIAGRVVIGLGSWEARDSQDRRYDLLIAQTADEAVNLALTQVTD